MQVGMVGGKYLHLRAHFADPGSENLELPA